MSIVLIMPGQLHSKDLFIRDLIPVDIHTTTYRLSASPIMKYSETIYADSILLYPPHDYQISYLEGIITVRDGLRSVYLIAEYTLIPDHLLSDHYRYQSFAWDQLPTNLPRMAPWFMFPEDGKLTLSGIKTFALTLSDDQAVDIKQSLLLNLSGELSPNVIVEARLSDNQSKLSPEGDTRELSSLDEVYFKVFGRGYELALGDLEWGFRDTRFINYHTKFEGINVWYNDLHAAQFAYSANNGKTSLQKLNIVDGKQGPYYLRATGFQQNFIVIAGSERIHLDGNLLERGTDYSIDYAEGSIMFRRLVSSTNSVYVRFQYSDEYYKQTMFLNSSEIRLAEKLRLRHSMIVQKDDKNSPLQYNFSTADIDSLRTAGDNVVWGQGVFEVEPGTGMYRRLFNDDGIAYYDYAPGDSTAIYLIYFSYVGQGLGDYEEFYSGRFRYVGMGLGRWLPQKCLIPPVLRSNNGLRLSYQSEYWETAVEALYSTNDKSTLSKLDDGDNDSIMFYASGRWKPDHDVIRPIVDLDFESRAAHSFLFADDTNRELDYDLYQLEPTDSLAFYQFRSSVALGTWFNWTPKFMVRYRKVRGYMESQTYRFLSRSTQGKHYPAFDLRNTISLQDYSDGSISRIQFHQANSSWNYRALLLRLSYLYDSIKYHNRNSNSGSRFIRFSPMIGWSARGAWHSQFTYTHDQSDKLAADWQTNRTSYTFSLNQLISTQLHQLNLDASRKIIDTVDLSEPAADADRSAGRNSFDLIRFRSYHNLLKNALTLLANYQLNNSEFFPRIRELEYIGSGMGLYDSTGVYNHNGDYDYTYITSETGILSTEIHTQINLYLKPSFISRSAFLRRINSDVMISATEQNSKRNDWKILLYLPQSVFNDSTTIYGRQAFQQTLWLDLITGKVTANAQFGFTRSLDQRYQSYSRSTSRQTSLEMELRQFRNHSYRVRFDHDLDTDTRYNSEIDRSDFSVQTQRNFPPLTIVQIDLELGVESGRNTVNDDTYDLHIIGLRPSIRSTIMQKYRIHSSLYLSRVERRGSSFLQFMPDKRQGYHANWNLSTHYRLNNFSSLSAEYSGNSFPKAQTQHQLKLEFKAEI